SYVAPAGHRAAAEYRDARTARRRARRGADPGSRAHARFGAATSADGRSEEQAEQAGGNACNYERSATHHVSTEREGFEPSNEVDPRYAISSRARSTAPAPLRRAAPRRRAPCDRVGPPAQGYDTGGRSVARPPLR